MLTSLASYYFSLVPAFQKMLVDVCFLDFNALSITVEHRSNDIDRGKTESLRENPVLVPLSIIEPRIGAKRDLSCDKPDCTVVFF
jgi:hypothetical protein